MSNKMQSINFSDGYKSFCINDDPDRVIRFNPTDIDIVKRFNQAMKELREEKDGLEDVNLNLDGTIAVDDDTTLEKTSEVLEKFNQVIREKLNFIFKSDVYDTIFDGQSSMAIVGKERQLLFEAFMDAAFHVINEEVEKATKERVNKYVSKYKDKSVRG
nr:MAG TPA: hypothetical protein [Caudoviricetes sp.]